MNTESNKMGLSKATHSKQLANGNILAIVRVGENHSGPRFNPGWMRLVEIEPGTDYYNIRGKNVIEEHDCFFYETRCVFGPRSKYTPKYKRLLAEYEEMH